MHNDEVGEAGKHKKSQEKKKISSSRNSSPSSRKKKLFRREESVIDGIAGYITTLTQSQARLFTSCTYNICVAVDAAGWTENNITLKIYKL